MLKVGEVKEIYEMKGSGRSTRGIAQELDVSRNTVRRHLKSPEATRPRPRPPRGSKLDPYAEHIDWRMGEGLENCRVLNQEVRSLGYQGNSSAPPPWPASKSRQLPARWRSTFATRDPRRPYRHSVCSCGVDGRTSRHSTGAMLDARY